MVMVARSIVALIVTLNASTVTADVAEFTSAQTWHDAVGGDYSTINFTGYADGTVIDDEYAASGLAFTSLNFIFASAGFVNDTWGLFGPNGIRFAFDTPQNWIALDYPGGVQFQLFSRGQLLYTSTFFQPGGLGNFAGLVSDTAFDEVYLLKPFPTNQVFIDDLHWGPAVPAPTSVAMFVFGALIAPKRRRS
jgi:hypothetical protein